MPPKVAFKPPAPTGAPATAEIIQEPPTAAAPEDTGGQGGGGDPDGGSGTAPADSATEPGGPAANGRQSPELPEEDAAGSSEDTPEPPEGFTFKASGGNEKSDEDDGDDAAPVPPAKPPRCVSSRVKGVVAHEPADAMAGTKKGKRTPAGGESAEASAARASRADVLAVEPSDASSQVLKMIL